jgi:hypothetical protein
VSNPLTDELSGEAKAVLAAQFERMRCRFTEFDVKHQRFINRTWADPMARFYR